MPPWTVVLILAFAAYRLTRLVTADKITAPLRELLFRWAYKPLEDGPELEAWVLLNPKAQDIPSHVPRGWEIRTWIYDLMTCDQCLGVWWAVAVYCAWRYGVTGSEPGTWAAILTVAAIAGVQSLIAWAADALSGADATG